MPPTSSRPRKMPFGKFKGIYLHDLPDDYLEWLSGLDNLREPLLTWVQEEFDAREAQSKMPAGDAKPMDRAVVAMAQEVIASGYHQLAKMHHPDKKGWDGKDMRLVNDAAAWLRAVVRGAAVRQ